MLNSIPNGAGTVSYFLIWHVTYLWSSAWPLHNRKQSSISLRSLSFNREGENPSPIRAIIVVEASQQMLLDLTSHIGLNISTLVFWFVSNPYLYARMIFG